MNNTALAQRIRAHASELGFDLVGFGSAEGFEQERTLILESLSNGYLDGMRWITPERVKLSCDPDALLPGARTIIGLGIAYSVDARSAPPDDRPRGRVARYARGRDYHDVIRPRLHLLPHDRAPRPSPDRAAFPNGRLGVRLRRLPGGLPLEPGQAWSESSTASANKPCRVTRCRNRWKW